MADLRLILVLAALALLVLVVVWLPRPPPAEEIQLTLEEWTMGFQTMVVPSGQLKFVVTNSGTMAHGFEIEGEIAGEEVEWEIEPFEPGLTKTLEVRLPPGTYEVYCPVPGHKEEGMVAELIVH